MVEWKKLGEVCEVLRGKRLTKNLLDANAPYPVYHGGLESLGRYSQYNREANTVMVINVGASAGNVGFCDCKFWSSDGCFCISHSELLNNKYLFYFLQTKTHFLQSQVRHAGIPTLDSLVIEKIKLPMLPLSVQSHIVSILDTFTSSIANLKQQIEERRKQYEYERDRLLDLEGKEGVEMKKLGEVCTIKNGYTPSTKNPDFWETGELPWFTLEDIRKNGRILDDAIKHITPLGVKKGGLFPKNSLIISTTATIGEYALILTDFLCNQQISCLSIKNEKQINVKYLYYLADNIGKWCKNNVNGGGSLLIVSTSKLRFMLIPLPSFEEQSRIVSILDTFEASIKNLEEQLVLRQKQYEYYRNKLLMFE